MKKLIPITSLLLLSVYLLISRFEIPMPDFAQGLLVGLSITGCIYTIAQFKFSNKKRAV